MYIIHFDHINLALSYLLPSPWLPFSGIDLFEEVRNFCIVGEGNSLYEKESKSGHGGAYL
jgi:hypothetical protein